MDFSPSISADVQPGGRERILRAAQELFPMFGFSKTSLRQIASTAGVDVALIGHYFGSKQGLYEEATTLAFVDHSQLARVAMDSPLDRLGYELIRQIALEWDKPEGQLLVAKFKTQLVDDPTLIHSALYELLWASVETRLRSEGIPDAERRVAFAASHIMGLGVSRMIIGDPVVVDLSVDELSETFGPVLQHALTG